MKNEENESKRLTPEELLRQIRAWLIMPSSSDGVERTAWPELVAQIDDTLSIPAATTPPETPSDAAMRAAREWFVSRGEKYPDLQPAETTATNTGYCSVCRSTHVLTANNCRAMDGIV